VFVFVVMVQKHRARPGDKAGWFYAMAFVPYVLPFSMAKVNANCKTVLFI
jgi:hypothetical protein